MEHPINLQTNRAILYVFFILLFNSCTNTNLADVNLAIPENGWTYAKSIKATVDIQDPALTYDVSFKIRNTSDYRYSNIYVIMRLKSEQRFLKDGRYQFQLAKATGQWIGKGSGNLYSNTFPLLKKFRFPKAGKYEIEVEQNMRDNPLVGISDVGITVESIRKD
ncbi:gliding motility lipoprotein GldH [Pedobacter sp. Du54]|uniref:gliding motility lipoprotein GldH n=1 Tax=Pedobacter anseongensis TaxID=3133439 RepID=UPI0030952E3C